MSSDEILASCRDLFRRHDRSMQSVAELLRRAHVLTTRSHERLDGRVEALGKDARRGSEVRPRRRGSGQGT